MVFKKGSLPNEGVSAMDMLIEFGTFLIVAAVLISVIVTIIRGFADL